MNVPDPVLSICRQLRSNGRQAWLVGGAVRDSLIGREAHDWDIATDALPEETGRFFPNTIPIGGHTGTVSVMLDGEAFEVTPFRSEGVYSDGRHPDEVRFVTTIEEDLSRRDFTMNAVAFDPINRWWADPFDGRRHIESGKIVAVGEPLQRFTEDGLRLLRAARFAAALDFAIASDTWKAMTDSADRIRVIAAERIHDEWRKTMRTESPAAGFDVMLRTGLLEHIAPEFLASVGCTQNRWHAYDVWGHTMRVMDAVPASDPVLRFAGLFHDIAKPATKGVHPETGDATFYSHEEVGAEMTDGILQRLKFSNDDRERIVHHVRHHLLPYEPGWTAAAVRRWVRRVGLANVPSLCSLGRADGAGKGTELGEGRNRVIDELEQRVATLQINAPIATSATQLAVDGRDVMAALGIGPGPQVGQALRALLELVTDQPELNEPEALTAKLEEMRCADPLPPGVTEAQ
jgi:tRNA nucleotidyltransferase (CCA-adding enzyme)